MSVAQGLPSTRCMALFGLCFVLLSCSGPRLELRPLADAGGQTPIAFQADAYEEGKRHLEAGRIGFAVQAFRAALARHPGSVRTLNALAVGYDRLGRRDLASRYFARALEVDPASPQTLNNLGYFALMEGDAEAATRYFQRALDGDGGHPTITANLQIVDAWRARSQPPMQVAVAASGAVAIRRAAWVERTSPLVQTIVTRPDPAVLAEAGRLQVDPRLVSYRR